MKLLLILLACVSVATATGSTDEKRCFKYSKLLPDNRNITEVQDECKKHGNADEFGKCMEESLKLMDYESQKVDFKVMFELIEEYICEEKDKMTLKTGLEICQKNCAADNEVKFNECVKCWHSLLCQVCKGDERVTVGCPS